MKVYHIAVMKSVREADIDLNSAREAGIDRSESDGIHLGGRTSSECMFINLGKPRPTRHTYFVNKIYEVYCYWIGRDIPSVEEQIETHEAISNWIDREDILQ